MTNNDNIIVPTSVRVLGWVMSEAMNTLTVGLVGGEGDDWARRSSRLSSSVSHCIAVKIAAWCLLVMWFV